MLIRFSIDFKTKWGQELYILGSSNELGNNNLCNAYKMICKEGSTWIGEIKCSAIRERVISYKYFVKEVTLEGKESIFYECGKQRSIALNSDTREITAFDQWQGNNCSAPFLSAPFSDVFYNNSSSPYTQTHRNLKEIIIKATASNIPANCKLMLCGNIDKLGGWDFNKALEMTAEDGCRWSCSISALNLEEYIEYKFVLVDSFSQNLEWEDSPNHKIVIPQLNIHSTAIYEHSQLAFKEGTISNYTNLPKFAGCSIPVFSLKSTRSHGIGDFSDILLLIDWMAECNMTLLQLLPINDTSQNINWKDSYPYNCISTFALHPIYIDLCKTLTTKELGIEQENLLKDIKREGKMLNVKSNLDYDDVIESKFRYLRKIYKLEKDNTFAQPTYYTFLKHNKQWLYPYAAFCTLRDKYKTTNFNLWNGCEQYSYSIVDEISSSNSDDFFFYVFVQYHLYIQMSEVKSYAHKHGVALKGDIPIGVAQFSVETWQMPHLFNFGQRAGAPPDNFSSEGQNWGFPTYNWAEMEKDNYSWWRCRFAQMSNFFDAYRLDHILGFFRIWEIPSQYKSSNMGHFSPALPISKKDIAKALNIDNIENHKDWFANINDLEIDVKNTAMFIYDPYEPYKFHPMISAKNSESYAKLSSKERESFDKLSKDYFYSRHSQLWYLNAVEKLQQLIASTNMLACGEDLGMLSSPVEKCMTNLNILSLELQIMPKEENIELGDPSKYRYLSVCTTSTHDTQTLRMWLGEKLNTSSQIEPDACATDCIEVIRTNLNSPSMLAILPLQDWLSIDENIRTQYASNERINNPENAEHYWRYRMDLYIEQLIENKEFNNKVKELILSSNR